MSFILQQLIINYVLPIPEYFVCSLANFHLELGILVIFSLLLHQFQLELLLLLLLLQQPPLLLPPESISLLWVYSLIVRLLLFRLAFGFASIALAWLPRHLRQLLALGFSLGESTLLKEGQAAFLTELASDQSQFAPQLKLNFAQLFFFVIRFAVDEAQF